MATEKRTQPGGDKPYDSGIKSLIRFNPKEWLEFLGVAVGNAVVEPLNADLSSLNLAADGLLRVADAAPYGVHIECESGAKGSILAGRLLTYNVFAERVTQLPFRSFAVLMTPKANSPALTGTLEKRLPDGGPYLTFRYTVIRLYDLPTETFLNAGLSVVPLTLLGDIRNADLPETVEKMRSRFATESGDKKQEQELLAATYVLTGARYSRELANKILKGALRNVFDVRESDTFQEIREIGLAEGIAEGIVEGRKRGILEGRANDILRIGTKRFGTPSPETIASITAVNESHALDQMLDRLLETESWDEFWQE
jgi:predicted transposase YdaD